jgi:hypothetical protein
MGEYRKHAKLNRTFNSNNCTRGERFRNARRERA